MNINPITNLTLAQRNNNNYITKYRKTSYSFKGSYNSDLAKTTREIKKEEGIGWSAGYKKNGFWGGLKGAAKSFFGAGSYAKKKAEEKMKNLYDSMQEEKNELMLQLKLQGELEKFKAERTTAIIKEANAINQQQKNEFTEYINTVTNKLSAVEQESKQRSLAAEKFQREQAIMQKQMFMTMQEQSAQIASIVQSFQTGMQDMFKIMMTAVEKVVDMMKQYSTGYEGKSADEKEKIKEAVETAIAKSQKEWEQK